MFTLWPGNMKRVAGLLALVLLLIPLLAALATLPAHRQIRSIAPPLPDFGDMLQALDVADGPARIEYLNSASQRTELGHLGHPGVLITWRNGRQFLVDTGMPPADAIEFGRPMEWLLGAEPTQTYGSLAEQLGEGVASVGGIAFTHLHNDHTDGLPEICARQSTPATVYQTPLQYHIRNYTTDLGFPALESAKCPRAQLSDDTIMRVPGYPGLIAMSLGGHTPGSTLYVVRVAERYWAFSGDITNDKKSLREDLPKPWLYSTFIVPEDTIRTQHLRRWLRALDDRTEVVVLPAHDVDEMAKHLPLYQR